MAWVGAACSIPLVRCWPAILLSQPAAGEGIAARRGTSGAGGQPRQSFSEARRAAYAGERPSRYWPRSGAAGYSGWSAYLSLGMTLVRETFNLWTPTYFTEAVGLTNADAAQKSALFPLFGGISVLLSGFLSDRLGRGWPRRHYSVRHAAGRRALLALGLANFKDTPGWPVALVALVAFLIIGPYAYLAGAIALDFGGKQGSGTASGLIDGVGYLGGVLAGNSMASIAVTWGWKGAFAVLAGVTWAGQHRRRVSTLSISGDLNYDHHVTADFRTIPDPRTRCIFRRRGFATGARVAGRRARRTSKGHARAGGGCPAA